MSVSQYMARALYEPDLGYYATRPSLGAAGDFVTAPEVSQMFGELLGVWAQMAWQQLGSPAQLDIAEYGPGRGKLMLDFIRAAAGNAAFCSAKSIHLIDISAILKQEQKRTLLGLGVEWVEQLPQDRTTPAIILANEVLDCLPIDQFVSRNGRWHERKIALGPEGDLVLGIEPEPHPLALPSAGISEGTLVEVCPGLEAWLLPIATRLLASGGYALFIDYGSTDRFGDTLQALRSHTKVSPLDRPGEDDLTAHVRFRDVASAAKKLGLISSNVLPQGRFLLSLGLKERAIALAKANPEYADAFAAQMQRLAASDQMGELFKVVCLYPPQTPPPFGFSQ
jgi:NADH dehydrogenase [ubiquinone] 1 alpha subcomplex assembly factor 7